MWYVSTNKCEGIAGDSCYIFHLNHRTSSKWLPLDCATVAFSVWHVVYLYVHTCMDAYVCLFSWRYNPLWLYFHSPVAGFSLLVFKVSWSHTQRHTTLGRTPLDERSARRRDLYLTKHNTQNRQTSMPPVGFEPTISAGKRP